ncbi:16S rRNA (uracil(1498)-N(3))-methyltransferase [Gordonia sp. (in: high G+C Gram-positive bacteria)]|jgi:16S rRNA (uracil1498-N3)-methyltransferase|uniref:16S rRNA (uracil(1498)-N(3))-methyltransferase n=1 Tax=Gordonia sp. (in: high G+C Gram-positive bacteria) TaxID=84139 RepID=UPI001DBCA558|nr:16S rRNA (uracil(1498)-N(3))-methyltransferase [Gordonia sp. (in: high G+C Gram-positive bacteria)]MCB1295776.1 16S rRNA (uracil(1498)-N(3))-methyltransferase [Gordonia sp. (in: high G+C Gram-positive bacteria)]HMS75054.1 16S rRNA (uracil(1498)-N(3))-methyltransferase [Gordonia sp. (in: high G+C Gram-positive bacteria)]
MGAPLFWVESVPSAGAEVLVSGPEGRHAVTVVRVRPGEIIRIGDGRGSVADCEVTEVAGKDKLRAKVRTFTFTDRPRPAVTVVQALPKAERSELAVDLATQAGADRIVPWQAARCVSRWTGKSDKGIRKWEQAAEAAAKQARRAWVPEITALAGTTDVRFRCAAAMAAGGVVAVLHEEAGTGFATLPLADAKEIVLVIGPEGGIDDNELADLTALGATAVQLGPEVLRTATAAAVALGAIGVMTQRWSR